MLARVVMSIVKAFAKPPTFVELPPVPIDAFNVCGPVVDDLRFMLVPSSLGTVFGTSRRLFGLSAQSSIADHGVHLELSAFLVMAWYAYRNKGALKISVLVRTIVSEATIYFLVMVAAQTCIQVSLSLTEVLALSRSRSAL